jgi:hypothetical protein
MTGAPRAPVAAAERRPTRGATRWLRVGFLGGVSLILATVAHVAGGGQLPTAGVLATTALFLGFAAVGLTARRCRFGVLLGVLMVQQTLLHVLFDAAARVAPGCEVTSMAGMEHAAHAALQVCDPSVMASMAPTGHLPSWGMWAAHLVATILTAGLLTRGEAWLWRVADEIVQAAQATPGGRPESEPARVLIAPPLALADPNPYSPADPRGPPPVLAVL